MGGAQCRGRAGSGVKCRQGQILWGLPGRARGLRFILSVSGSHWRLFSRRVSRSYLPEKKMRLIYMKTSVEARRPGESVAKVKMKPVGA